MSKATPHLLMSAILCTGLSTAVWAQVGSGTGSTSTDQNSTDTRVGDRMQDKAAKAYDKEAKAYDKDHKHDGMKHGMGNQASMGVLRDSFGVSLRPLQRDMAASHNLKPGVGLVVEDVSADSLAANSKLQKGDIIFQLGDQWVINPDQFATLLSMQEVNDDFELKVYRGTERVDLDFELDQAAIDSINRGFTPAMGAIDQSTDRVMDRATNDWDRNRQNMGGNNPIIIPEKFNYEDDQHDIAIRTEDGVKKLTVKDKDGNVLFDGPYNTMQEREAVPADVKMKVEQVLREKVK